MWEDPIVQEVRDARERHAGKFNFDMRAIYEDFKKIEQQSGRKTVSFPPKRIQPILLEYRSIDNNIGDDSMHKSQNLSKNQKEDSIVKSKVYIDTTIPSFYYDERTVPEVVARRLWTRSWWDNHRSRYEVYTSTAVVQEIATDSLEGENNPLHLEQLPLLGTNEAIADAVASYISHRVMPNDPTGDALHLAIASFHKCDFIVTWNCRHLANANKFGHIRRVNTLLGLFVPTIVTPLGLLG